MNSSKRGDIIGQKYEVIKKIGAGSFGTIYLGKFLKLLIIVMTAEHIDTKEQYAIKAEPLESKYPMIIYEANICNIMQGINVKAQSLAKNQLHQVEGPKGIKGFAKIKCYG